MNDLCEVTDKIENKALRGRLGSVERMVDKMKERSRSASEERKRKMRDEEMMRLRKLAASGLDIDEDMNCLLLGIQQKDAKINTLCALRDSALANTSLDASSKEAMISAYKTQYEVILSQKEKLETRYKM